MAGVALLEKGWAHVEFICDKNKVDVPISFLENFEKLETVELNKIYNVFWSPNEADTPTSIKEREGKVLKIDKIKRATKNSTIPIAGYYSATLLHIAVIIENKNPYMLDSEENLHKKMDLQRTRRVPLHLRDLVEQAHSSNNAIEKSSKRKELDKEAAREANFKRICVDENTEETKEQLKVRVEGLEATVNSLDGLYKDSLEKIDALKKENDALRQKNNDLSEENVHTLDSHTIPDIEQIAQSDKVNIIEKGYEVEDKEVEDTQVEDKEVEDKEVEGKEVEDKEVEGKEVEVQEVQDDVEQGFRLSEDQFKACNVVPLGKTGDSKCVKNVTDLLWSRQELSRRSVTGMQCPNNKEVTARPECTPAKKQYLSEIPENIQKESLTSNKVSANITDTAALQK
ncbi:BEN domain-containing protein 5-like [Diabrotica virgifera virgifera]|uniref:Uncharacterized protein n=1 Tax=Diabrotica virgifera virgifera TaxID=50390 RepID=A0ABM5K0C7_DIAVI|nr:BEN domain-containing protein 5-like [Diabrotica virgifera virgifera]